jgi:lysophospholipase L1-like esterase
MTAIETNDEEGPSRYDVLVDGQLASSPFVPNVGQGTYDLATGLAPDQSHVVELHRRTEAMVGITQILGFEFPNSGALLAPPAWPNRHIEFLGDSESTGYGVECTAASQAFTGATENERKAYPFITATKLNAESANISYSGKGLIRNEVPNTQVFTPLYLQAIPMPGAPAWDFAVEPDVVWITLGANDWEPGPNGDRPPPDANEFKTKYGELVALVRSKYPDAQIVCAVQGMLNDDWPVGWNALTNVRTILQAVVNERHLASDLKVQYHELPRATESDLTGCDSHPNVAFHEKAAASVAAKLREITGWP